MKKFLFLVFLLFTTSFVFSQLNQAVNLDANVTVTNEQIKAWGETSLQNGSRDVFVLNFEGLGDLDNPLNYYNGGLSSLGFGPGPNYGIVFAGGSLAVIDSDAGGSANSANEPSPETTLVFLDDVAIMNVPAGFTTGFSFYYSSQSTGTLAVFDGLNGTGNQIGSAVINNTGTGPGDPNGIYYANWIPVGVAFAGTAYSVVFGGTANYVLYDDITFGSVTPGPPNVPISNWALFIGIGLILIFAVIRFRRLI